MRENTLLYLTILVTCLTSVLIAEKPPNIILVLADDLGYSDAGCFGGDVQTPNLDSLAESGLRFTQMYSTGRCWPSRAVLMTGYYAQQVGMDPRRGKEWPSWSRLLPLRLKEIGRVMAQVKTMREADNTVFIFVSDNGASGENDESR